VFSGLGHFKAINLNFCLVFSLVIQNLRKIFFLLCRDSFRPACDETLNSKRMKNKGLYWVNKIGIAVT
jgi:hypothetical protein